MTMGKRAWSAWWGRTVSVSPGREGEDQGRMVTVPVLAEDGSGNPRPVDLYLTPREAEALGQRLMESARRAREARMAHRELETF